jgi:hypothetical protein
VSGGCNGNGYIGGVLFVDGGFCVGNELSSKFLHSIWAACRVQGMGMGDGRGGQARRCQEHLARQHEAES